MPVNSQTGRFVDIPILKVFFARYTPAVEKNGNYIVVSKGMIEGMIES